MEPLINL